MDFRALQLAEAQRGQTHKPRDPRVDRFAQALGGPALDATRGALMGVTTDVLGYPVDLATQAMRPLGYDVAKPVGGSDWLADKLTSPTGSKFETAGRVASGMLTPGPEDLLRMMGVLKPKAPVQELITYHGSPHRINNVDEANPMGKFDLSKVGTGEGAQAYGHGIYLAENPTVAKSYKYAGADGYFTLNGAPPRPKADVLGPGRELAIAYDDAAAKAKSLGLDPAISYYEDQIKFFPQYADEYARPLEQLKAMKAAGAKTTPVGHFYTVDLPDEHIAKMLDWDAPLSEQPEAVRKALERATVAQTKLKGPFEVRRSVMGNWHIVSSGGEWSDAFATKEAADLAAKMPTYSANITFPHNPGRDIYSVLSDRLGGDQQASEYLRSLGIPGIRYFDGGSRAAGEGTRNFVIFDGDTAKILKRE